MAKTWSFITVRCRLIRANATMGAAQFDLRRVNSQSTSAASAIDAHKPNACRDKNRQRRQLAVFESERRRFNVAAKERRQRTAAN